MREEREREKRGKTKKKKLAAQQKKLALCGALIKATCNQKSTSGGPFARVKRLQWTWGEEQRCNIVGTFRLV